MNKFKGLIFSICVLQFFSCDEKECIVSINEQKANNIELKITKDNCNERLLKEQEFLKISSDSLIPHGFYKEYFKNGKLSSFAFFKNGLQDSLAIKYYQNGQKELEYYWDNGKTSGFQNQFYPNGQYKIRTCFDNNSLITFKAVYDSSGKIDSLEGTALNVVFNKQPQSLKLGEEFNIINEVITLENVETLLTLKLIDPNKKTLVDTTVKQFLVFKNQRFIPIVYSPKEKGEYKYNVTVQLVDELNKVIKTDSFTSILNVR